MNLEPKLESLEARLKGVTPSLPSDALLSRLESAVAEVQVSCESSESNVIAFPTMLQLPQARWMMAAAAMVAALLMAVSSTRVVNSGASQFSDSNPSASELQPVYQIDDGFVVPHSEHELILPVDSVEDATQRRLGNPNTIPNPPVK